MIISNEPWHYRYIGKDAAKDDFCFACRCRSECNLVCKVLQCPYEFNKVRLVVREMTDLLVPDLVDKGLVTDQIVLTVSYDIDNLKDPGINRLKKHYFKG